MAHEFDDAEMYPCDICGEGHPVEEMYEIEDGRMICQDCLEELDNKYI